MKCLRILVALLSLNLFALDVPAQRAIDGRSGGISPSSITEAYSQDLWPKVAGVATVYYVIDPASDSNAFPNISAAINIFNTDFKGVIQWVLLNPPMPGQFYVDINLSAGDLSGVCEANEGYEAVAAQPMTGSTNCTVGTILHEMGHVIGLWHEQSRSDRGTYVTVSYANVIKGSWGNFQPITDDEQILAPYDYASVMHYIPYAFTANGLPVIETIPAGIPLAGAEGVPAVAGISTDPALPNFDYSAGDKETILRLYGAAPKNITVTSNPVGLSVIVDGVTVTTPQTYSWQMFSTHTLNVPSEVQILSGYILYSSNPQIPADFYYTYGRWNNSSAQSQTILVTPGSGTPTFPTTSPQIATYSANFIQLVPYTPAAIYPSTSGGTATISPQPLTYFGGTDEYFVARQSATLTATGSTGWAFYEFNNGPFWLPGGLGANPKIFNVPDSGNPVDPTAEFSNTPIFTINASPETYSSNLSLYVDGVNGFVYLPKNFSAMYDSSWTTGSPHTLNFPSPEHPYSYNSRYSFSAWSANVGAGGNITLPANNATYTANVSAQYQPATNFSYPPCGGTASLSPPSPTGDGFYPAGQVLSFTAAPDSGPGWKFGGWTYDLTGTASPANLTANGETLVFANFNIAPEPLTLTAVTPASAKAGGKAVVLTLTGTGFAPGSLVFANGKLRTVTHVSSTTMKISLTPADIAIPGAFAIYVENFPSGWNGCAVFGQQTFLVGGKGAPAATPVFSPKAGHYTTAQSVMISDAIAGAIIYYTTNGKTPTTSSPRYTGPILVSANETLKADVTATGYLRSAVATAKYTIP
jgi:Astacin (Peptidase family M12A)/Chitobiase/beta-hexosaminidase C-terminal domain/Divergent InlB B-repeat domain